MADKEKQKVTLSLKHGTLDILRHKAKEVGMLIERGSEAGNGNVSEYLDSLAWADRNLESELPLQRLIIGYTAAGSRVRREIEFKAQRIAERWPWLDLNELLSEAFSVADVTGFRPYDAHDVQDDIDEIGLNEVFTQGIKNALRFEYGVSPISEDLNPEQRVVEHLFKTDDDRFILLVSILWEVPREYLFSGDSPEPDKGIYTKDGFLISDEFVERFLVELHYEDLCPGGGFRHLGRQAGIAPTLTLDEALTLQQKLYEKGIQDSPQPSKEEHNEPASTLKA